MKKRILSLTLAVVMLLGVMPLCASAEDERTPITEMSFQIDMEAVIGKKYYEYADFVKILSPNIHFEPDPRYSSLVFFDADTGEQVLDEIVEGKEYGVCLKIYPADGYSIPFDSRVIINGRELVQYSQYEMTFVADNMDIKIIMFGIIAGEEIEYKKIDLISLTFDSVACAGKSPSAYRDIVTINSEHIDFVDYEADIDGDQLNEPLQVLNVYHIDGTELAVGETMKAGEEYRAFIYLMTDFGYYVDGLVIRQGVEINGGAECKSTCGFGVGRSGRNFVMIGVRFVAGEPLKPNYFKLFLQKIAEFLDRLFDRIFGIFGYNQDMVLQNQSQDNSVGDSNYLYESIKGQFFDWRC